ncbi:hypothetical protein GWN42_31465 [candidate division KSB1 bacterium]|nr:hypothetical protein [Phycisphaerae bacterium]NIQ92575.1 hypothetical protein [Deltaproteobacteria bacterium]NIV97188.1 hypothetical protein [candidate division KSB1 bacterium]
MRIETAIEMTREYARVHIFPVHGWFEINEEDDGLHLPTVDDDRITSELEWVYDTLVAEPNSEAMHSVYDQMMNKEI